MLIEAVLWAFCLPLLPLCWLQQKMIRRHSPKRDAVTLPTGWSGGASPVDSPRRLLGIGDQGIVAAGGEGSVQGVTANCAESLMRQSAEKTVWQVAGQAGATASDVLATCRGINDLNVDLILISMGVNDVSGMTSLVKWQTGIFDLIVLIRQKGNAKVVFLGLPPMARFEPLPQPLRLVCGIRARLLDAVLKRSVSPLGFALHLEFNEGVGEGKITDDGYHLGADVQKDLGDRAATLGLRLLQG